MLSSSLSLSVQMVGTPRISLCLLVIPWWHTCRAYLQQTFFFKQRYISCRVCFIGEKERINLNNSLAVNGFVYESTLRSYSVAVLNSLFLMSLSFRMHDIHLKISNRFVSIFWWQLTLCVPSHMWTIIT